MKQGRNELMAFRRAAASVMLLLGASPAACMMKRTPMADGPLHHLACTSKVIDLPILSDEGGLVVPVRINEREAAAILTPRASNTFILKPDGLDLYHGMPVTSISLTGEEDSYWSTLDTLQLGTAVTHGVPAIVIDRPDLPTLDGRGVVLSIGYDILGNYEMLVDLSAKRLLLFQYQPSNCQSSQSIFTGATYVAPLQETESGQVDVVDVVLNGTDVEMQINTGSDASIISRLDAERAGVSRQALASDPQVRTEAHAVRLGFRHRFESFTLGGYTVRQPKIDVDPRITYNPLGLDFFRDKIVLLDFPGSRMIFQTIGNASLAAFHTESDRFGTVQTKNVSVSVTQGPGK